MYKEYLNLYTFCWLSIYVTVTSLFINSWSLPVTALKGKQWSLGLAPSPELLIVTTEKISFNGQPSRRPFLYLP